MQKEKQLKRKSGIHNIDPYLDKEGLLKVRGKIQIFVSVTFTLFLLVTKAKQQP